ncbi:unnamed protein product [Toxocara canis]|uniref:ADP-ribosylhydrolase ARH3 n=1 Tax=Toxocara canis TaxID=6265 RepID=A0A183VC59_TOXCA|nr:unnamed protein product [Toxocara canis]
MSIKKAIGCLYGQLIGDALGCRYEFMCAVDTQGKMAKDLTAEKFLPILGGDVACAYVRWEQSSPPDIGIATASALGIEKRLSDSWMDEMNAESKQLVHDAVVSNARQYNVNRLSNGCLMRISPLAVASVKFSIDKIKEVVKSDCILTHCEMVCIDATISYVVAIRHLINDHTPQEAYNAALEISETETVKDVLICAENAPIPVKAKGKLINGDKEMMGYVGVALQSAFYELLHATSFYDGVLAAVSRGGDTDTNGAIVAAMLGARFGVDAIPSEWLETVRSAKVRDPSLQLSYNVEEVVPQLLELS